MVCRYSGYATINKAYADTFVDGYPNGGSWYAAMFPYDDIINYLERIAADTLQSDGELITLSNKNSDCYPTIIFE